MTTKQVLTVLIIVLLIAFLGFGVYREVWRWWPFQFTQISTPGYYETVANDDRWVIRSVQPVVIRTYEKNGAIYLNGVILKNKKRYLITFYLGKKEDQIGVFTSDPKRADLYNVVDIRYLLRFGRQTRLGYLANFVQEEPCSYDRILCQAANFLTEEQKLVGKFPINLANQQKFGFIVPIVVINLTLLSL